MNLKRRLRNLELKPRLRRTAPQLAAAIVAELDRRSKLDPETFEAERRARLVELGFPAGYEPNARELIEAHWKHENQAGR